MTELPDVQASINNIFSIKINKVGIKGIRYPILVKQKIGAYQNTIGTFNLYCEINEQQRGAHLSRFITLLNNENPLIVNYPSLYKILYDISISQDSHRSFIELTFPYFIYKKSPVSNLTSLLEIEGGFFLSYDLENEYGEFYVQVKVPVTTLCPCSKELCINNAHNQRADVLITIYQPKSDNEKDYIWIEDLIDIAEASCSSPIYSLLKREDEKYVTEQMYNNPKFVEDVVRECSKRLIEAYGEDATFVVECNSYESIHNHTAYASIERNLV